MGSSRGLVFFLFLCVISQAVLFGANDDLEKSLVPKPEIVKITVTVKMPDGRVVDQLVDPKVKEALFWSDAAIENILAPFYDKSEKWLGEEKLMELYGKGIIPLLKAFRLETRDSARGREIRMSSGLIKFIWKNLGFAFLEKMPPCYTGAYPPKG